MTKDAMSEKINKALTNKTRWMWGLIGVSIIFGIAGVIALVFSSIWMGQMGYGFNAKALDDALKAIEDLKEAQRASVQIEFARYVNETLNKRSIYGGGYHQQEARGRLKPSGTIAKSTLVEYITPTTFQAKILSIYLTEDITTGNAPDGAYVPLFINSACQGDIVNCDIGGTTALYQVGSTTYTDLLASSATINTGLATTLRPVTIGTYKYVTLNYCNSNVTGLATNIKFQGGNMTSAATYALAYCQIHLAFATPLVVAVNTQTLIFIKFDDTNTIAVYDANTALGCATQANQSYCFTPPAFVPTPVSIF